jgi:hypothetical protein
MIRLSGMMNLKEEMIMKFTKHLALVGMSIFLFTCIASSEEGTMKGPLDGLYIGGHVKMFLYDGITGEVNGVKQQEQSSAGFGYSALQLYVSKELESWLSFNAQVEWNVNASATPTLGKPISRVTSPGTVVTTPTGTTTVEAVKANIFSLYLSARLPYEIDMKAGSFLPMFSEYYATEEWWSYRYHNDAQITQLISVRDTGIELHRDFDISKVTMPVYFYLTNGDDLVDNNNDKMVMVHVAPEFLNSKLKLLGSYGMGKYDVNDENNMMRYEYGAQFTQGPLYLYGEVLYSNNQNSFGIGLDKVNRGEHIQGTYRITDNWLAGIGVAHVELANTDVLKDTYDTNTLLLTYYLTSNSSIIGQYSIVNAKRSDDSQKLVYDRFTLGWRTTF